MKRIVLAAAVAIATSLGWTAASAETKQLEYDQVTLDRVLFATSLKWYVLKSMAVSRNVLYYRKYALPVIDDQIGPFEKIKNITSFACQRNSRLLDHVVVHVPQWVSVRTIDEGGWYSKIELRILLDGATFTTVGEYRSKEFFIDITEDNRNSMLELLDSSEIIIEFGPAREQIRIRQAPRTPDGTGNIDGFLEQVVPTFRRR
jgi:hypothetical protein